jgi:hypothetical protein
LKEKVTKKFKENPIAPRVFPCLRAAKADIKLGRLMVKFTLLQSFIVRNKTFNEIRDLNVAFHSIRRIPG